MKHIYVIAAMIGLASSSNAQQVSRLAPRGRIMAKAAANSGADRMVPAFLTADNKNVDWAALDRLGVKVGLRLDSVATVRIPVSSLEAVSQVKGVKYVQVTSTVRQMLDLARPEAGADKVAAGTGLDQGYTGSGVVVGIVDAGFDYAHKAFYGGDGKLRIKRVWEQNSDPASFPDGEYVSPEKFGYGIEMTTPEQIEKAGGDITGNSHGIHVANIAAGSDTYKDGAYRGTAPDADIVLVSMGETSRDAVNLTNALAYIFDYAESVGKPCVINLSLGSHAGPHDGTSTFDVIADQLQGKGRIIVGSAGNQRTDKFHIAHTFNSAEDTPLKTFVSFKNGPSTYYVGGDVEVWGSQESDFEVYLSAYNVRSNTEAKAIKVYPSDGEVQQVEFDRYMTGTLSVSTETSPLNGKPHVLISSQLTGLRANYALALTVVPKNKCKVDVWADDVYVGLESKNLDGFSDPDASSSTIAEIGGTAKRILTVGSYTTRNEYTVMGSTTAASLKETVGDISSFSSYGPTADGRLKPEVTAPGCFIISAESSNDNSGTQILSDVYEADGRDYRYGYMQGTSMSSPFVAGVVASWLQAYPTMTPEELHEIVKQTSRRDSYTGDIPSDGDASWGYGKIDAYAGLKECIEKEATGIAATDVPFDGKIYVGGDALHVIFATASSRASVRVCGVDGRVVSAMSVTDVVPGKELSLGIGSLRRGVYVVTVKTDSGAKTVKMNI